jgi:hypothetical protein
MTKRDVVLGHVYAVKVSGRIQQVRLVAESPHGGWVGRNLQTGREVRIRSAARIRYPIRQASHEPQANQRFQQELTERGASRIRPARARVARPTATWCGLGSRMGRLANGAANDGEFAMNETRAVKDLAIGDSIQVKGFDDPMTVRSAKKVQKGTDAGKLDVKLAGPDGSIETVRFDPEEAVVVVGKDADRGQPTPKSAAKGKSKGKSAGKAKATADQPKAPKGKGKAKTPETPAEESTSGEAPPTPEPNPELAATDAPEVTATQAEASQTETTVVEAPQTETTVAEPPQAGEAMPEPTPTEAAPEATTPVEPAPTETPTTDPGEQAAKPKRARGRKAQPDADGQSAKLSAIDAAAKVLAETGQAMNCQELIGAMAAKDYWTSPGGKTPAATLYSAILRELQTKGNDARFVKAARGKFALNTTSGKEQA